MLPMMALVALCLLLPASAQASTLYRRAQTNATCTSDFLWSDNAQNLSPCLLASALTGSCLQGEFNVSPVTAGSHYDVPGEKDVKTITQCACSWAAYNLYSACTACQGSQFLPSVQTWAAYRKNCGQFLSNTTYWPADTAIQGGFKIPFYAGTNPAEWQDQKFNVGQAQKIAADNHPDLTGAAPASTSTAANSKSKTPVGAIAGGVVGGIALLVAIVAGLWFLRRRRRSMQGVQELDSHTPTFHRRSFSDSTAKSPPFASFTSFGNTHSTSPPPAPRSPTLYTHNESYHSLSRFGSVSNFTTAANPVSPSRDFTSPSPTMQTTQTMSREDYIQPFIISQQPQPSVPRKGTELSFNPYERGVNRLDDIDDDDSRTEVLSPATTVRPRLNPPAYTAHPAPSETSSYDVAEARRERHGHGHRPTMYPREKDSSQDTTTTTQHSTSTTSPWTSVGTTANATMAVPMGILHPTGNNAGTVPGHIGQVSNAAGGGAPQNRRMESTRSVVGQDEESVEIA